MLIIGVAKDGAGAKRRGPTRSQAGAKSVLLSMSA